MKKKFDLWVHSNPSLKKLIMELKIAFFIIVAGVSNVLANPGYSQVAKVSLDMENKSLEQVMDEIERQSEFYFIFNQKQIDVNRIVDIQVENELITDILPELFKGTDVNYAVLDRKILLTTDPLENNLQVIASGTELQQTVVTGKVVDSNGAALPGVNIVVKGTMVGSITDTQGRYSINAPDPNAVLVFSFIGYAPQETAVNRRSVVDVTLAEELSALDEVVITALGISREKKALAYSVTEVKGSGFTQAKEMNVANSLSGIVAGVNVSGNSTGPGGSSRVIIRGNGSLSGNNQPLYVLNGMPMDNTIPNGGTSSSGSGINIDRGDGIAGINPDDIETISVLKGGAAAALYGSRASNGVILITTKKGIAQKGIGVELNSTFTFETPSVIPDWQYEYGQGIDGVKPISASGAKSTGRLSFGAKMDGEPYIQSDGVMRPYSPVYIKDNIKNFYRTGTDYTNTLAFTGGIEAINFRLSLSDMTANSITPNSSINRRIANLNLNASLGKKLSFQALGQYNIEVGTNRPKVGYADYNANWCTYLIANTMDIRTLSPGYDENFNEILWNASNAATNPYFVINRLHNEDKKNRFIGQINIKFDILKNLFVKAGVSQDYFNFKGKSIIPTGTAPQPLGSMSIDMSSASETNSLLSLNYSSTFFNDLNFSAMAGGSLQESIYDGTTINGSEFTIPFFYSYTNVASLTTSPFYRQSKINSIFGSADIGYKRVAFLTITARKDWFSTLSPKSNSILYPSIGGSFIVSQAVELPSVINFMKIRGSWAQVGGATPDPYILNQTYNMAQGGHNGRPVQSLSSGLVTNPDLKPLTSTTSEAGIDVQFLESRLALDLTLYDRKTTNDIVRSTISSATGYTQALLNVGELSNKGIEVMLTGAPVKSNNFFWNISYNVGYNKSKIIKLVEGVDVVTVGSGVMGITWIQNVVGLPYGTVWGNVYKTDDQGQTVFNTTSNLQVVSELKNLGVGVPPLTMGLTNSFGYKNFSLSILLDGKFGNRIWSNTNWYATRFGLPKSTLPGRENGLLLTGVDETGAPYSYTVPVAQIDNYYNAQQSYPGLFTYDGSFIKVRQVILGYTLPAGKIRNIFQSASISLVARNLFILYRKTDNFDPEASLTSDNAQGLESFGLPRTKSIGINLQVKF